MAEPLRERHVLQWHITHLCNLRCLHCYQEDYAAHMEPEMMERVLEKYERYLDFLELPGQINLTGGEPLLHPRFFELASKIRAHGHRLAVLTNGTLIDESCARRLKELRPVIVQLSLDGVKVLVSFTAQKPNRDQLPALAALCREHGVDKLWWDRVVTSGEEETEALALRTEDFLRLVEKGNRLRAEGFPVDNSRALQFIGDDSCGGYRCSAGGNLLIVLADGSLMPCRRLPFTVGHIDDGEIAPTLAKSPVMCALSLARVPAVCRICPDVLRCFGGAKCVTFAQTGDWDRPDVNCPRLAKGEDEKRREKAGKNAGKV